MISFEEIKSFFTESIRRNPSHFEYMLKEYFHYRMLDMIFSSEYASKLSFIGGTNLRILHHIPRFSEDLDFDCFLLSREEFYQFTGNVISKLREEGIKAEAEDKEKDLKLTAFRRNIVFPGLLFELGLTGHQEKKLLIKIECEPHQYVYDPVKPIIQKFNVFTQIFAPSPAILLSMKTGAVLERGKGRDYMILSSYLPLQILITVTWERNSGLQIKPSYMKGSLNPVLQQTSGINRVTSQNWYLTRLKQRKCCFLKNISGKNIFSKLFPIPIYLSKISRYHKKLDH